MTIYHWTPALPERKTHKHNTIQTTHSHITQDEIFQFIAKEKEEKAQISK